MKLCRVGGGTEDPFQKLADIVNSAKTASPQNQPRHQLVRVWRVLTEATAALEELSSGPVLLPTETKDARDPHELFDR